jgi:predicted XRE-type DNA-binding protein
MKNKKFENPDEFGKSIGVSSDRQSVSRMKTKIKQRILSAVEAKGLSAAEVAKSSGLSRTVISGILHGSLQSVSLERLIRLAAAVDLEIELSIREAA